MHKLVFKNTDKKKKKKKTYTKSYAVKH